MKTIIFTAVPFCFGPVGKAIAIADSLHGVRKIFFGTSVALDLASSAGSFDTLYDLSLKERERIIPFLANSDLFINVMDFDLIPLAKTAGCPQYFIDSLFWFWPELPDGANEVEIYFCQNFFSPVAGKIREYGLRNARLIGPIFSPDSYLPDKKDQTIINFGGLENPHVEIGSNSNYPFVILRDLLPLLQHRFANILVTGRERVMKMLRSAFGENERVKFEMIPPKRMLEELSASKALFTTPGIQTFLDAADKMPIFCLPPHNSSQVRNLDAFVSQGIIKHFLKWDELYEFDHQRNSDEGEEVRLVLEKIKLFEHSEENQRVLQSKAEIFLNASRAWPELVALQKQAVKNLGTNGVLTIVNEINRLLCGHTKPMTSHSLSQ